MTDIEQKRIKAICEVAHVKEIDDVSDGFHTFKELYYQRMMLFATIVKQNKDKAWKSLRHEDGELCFGGGWFIVGVDTPEGSYTYHYEDNFYSLFDCIELERGKHWDGHTDKDVTRLLSLEQESKPGYCKDCKWWKDSDGAYRRGVGAESQCPINRKEVFEGKGYCYMFEPKESETEQGLSYADQDTLMSAT